MFHLRAKNEHRKIEIANIVALQGDDYNEMCEYLDADYNGNSTIAAWLIDSDIVNYLLQWYQDSDSRYMSSHYDAYHLTVNRSAFLGKMIKVKGYKGYFLYNHDSRLGYASLSRLVEIERGI